MLSLKYWYFRLKIIFDGFLDLKNSYFDTKIMTLYQWQAEIVLFEAFIGSHFKKIAEGAISHKIQLVNFLYVIMGWYRVTKPVK